MSINYVILVLLVFVLFILRLLILVRWKNGTRDFLISLNYISNINKKDYNIINVDFSKVNNCLDLVIVFSSIG